MRKEELVDILYTHGIAAGLDCNGQQALNAMVAAYNKAVEDCEKAASELGYRTIDFEQLKIKD
jgi:phage terminase small subunit